MNDLLGSPEHTRHEFVVTMRSCFAITELFIHDIVTLDYLVLKVWFNLRIVESNIQYALKIKVRSVEIKLK